MGVMNAVSEATRRAGSVVGKSAGILREDGPLGFAQRLARYAYTRLDAGVHDEPLRDADIADSGDLALALPAVRPAAGTPLRIAWVIVPPGPGSGGHTTLFRMVEAVEQAGHTCELYVFDRYGGDVAVHERVIREWWPAVRARVHDASEGIRDVDAAVASGWDTAHVLARRGTGPMRRLYFIQDFEPYFYARGSMYSLAEDTYRFGFRCIALGEMVARLLRSEVGIEPDTTEFGCDTSVYRLLPDSPPRTRVIFHARPEVPRRGFWLARLALQRFHELHPEIEIHTYGSVVRGLPFPAVQHGKLSPERLNELYNSSIAGIAMSFTNISLVAEEMLAAGVSPVVNDSVHSRADLANPHVVWAAPTPGAIAAALSAAVTDPERASRPEVMAASVRRFGWSKAQRDVVKIIEHDVYGEAHTP